MLPLVRDRALAALALIVGVGAPMWSISLTAPNATTRSAAQEASAEPARAATWPQWRGPDRDGRLDHSPTAQWPEQLELVWRVPVAGGYSSPVVADGRVFVHERRDPGAGQPGVEVLRALSLTDGRELWASEPTVAPFSQNQYATAQGAGPFSTPTVDRQRGRVYSYGVNGVLEGRDVATGDLACRMTPGVPDTTKLFTGTSMSPLVLDGGEVVVHAGDDGGGRLLAFRCDEEATKWTWAGDGPGYASPVVFETDGVKQLVTLTDGALIGVDAASGALLWSVDFPDEWNENIVTPTVFEDLVLVSGVRRGALAVRLRLVDGKWQAPVVWERPERTHYMSSPVLLPWPTAESEASAITAWVGLSNKRKGQLVALDARTGDDLWLGDGRLAQSASLVRAGQDLLVLTVEGELIVLRAAQGALVEQARYAVADEAIWAHLAVADDLLVVRSAEHLQVWRAR